MSDPFTVQTYYCTTTDCPEYHLPKEDVIGVEGVVCGECGQPVTVGPNQEEPPT